MRTDMDSLLQLLQAAYQNLEAEEVRTDGTSLSVKLAKAQVGAALDEVLKLQSSGEGEAGDTRRPLPSGALPTGVVGVVFDGILYEGDMESPPSGDLRPGAIQFLSDLLWKYQLDVFIITHRDPREVVSYFHEVVLPNLEECPFRVDVIPEGGGLSKGATIGVTNRRIPAYAYVDPLAVRFADFNKLVDYVLEKVTFIASYMGSANPPE